jgi:hypothetical protein
MKKLTLNRETLKLLSPTDAARVYGGMRPAVTDSLGCDPFSKVLPCSSGCPKSRGSGCC